ncbi:cytochrome b [Silvimonas amylolytica]|uniref:Cytochrome b n=1 Tax=Silvimonas amylolytica TaxID=449663 RepID=A0ABQ2PLL9_9NEIS|nr:cytochrome b [Silvimonas amylolytica]GGP26291.1 cytochrome b [Silvimonas amylolytica]
MKRTRYDGFHIALHWLIAALIVAAFGLALYIDELPLSPLKFRLYSYHKWMGISVLILVAVRLLWRHAKGVPAPLPNQPRWQVVVANATHHTLYLLMFVLPLAGWAMSSAKGIPVVLFGVLPLPDWVPVDHDLGEILETAHKTLAWILAALVAMHAAAAIKHHVIDKDDTLRRMLPGKS